MATDSNPLSLLKTLIVTSVSPCSWWKEERHKEQVPRAVLLLTLTLQLHRSAQPGEARDGAGEGYGAEVVGLLCQLSLPCVAPARSLRSLMYILFLPFFFPFKSIPCVVLPLRVLITNTIFRMDAFEGLVTLLRQGVSEL